MRRVLPTILVLASVYSLSADTYTTVQQPCSEVFPVIAKAMAQKGCQDIRSNATTLRTFSKCPFSGQGEGWEGNFSELTPAGQNGCRIRAMTYRQVTTEHLDIDGWLRNTQSTTNRSRSTAPGWPQKSGVYIANSSEGIPHFPRALSGYRPAGNDVDFWGHPFPSAGSIRAFQWEWSRIPDFPVTMNGCSAGLFMLRWRAGDFSSSVQTSLGGDNDKPMGATATGSYGYMLGTNCDQPMFKLAGNGHGLVDVYYELTFWQAAP